MAAKTVNQVIAEVKMTTGEALSVSRACKLVNDAVQILTSRYSTAGGKDTEDLTDVEAGVQTPLPNLGVLSVTKEGRPVYDYSVDSEGITFMVGGDFSVVYIPIPAGVTLGTHVVPLVSMYHPSVVAYVASKAAVGGDTAEFDMLARDVHITLTHLKKRNMRIPARSWR